MLEWCGFHKEVPMAHKAKPGKLLVVERYDGADDKTFDVDSAEDGLTMAKGLYGSMAVVDAAEFVRYDLVDETGAIVPWPKAA